MLSADLPHPIRFTFNCSSQSVASSPDPTAEGKGAAARGVLRITPDRVDVWAQHGGPMPATSPQFDKLPGDHAGRNRLSPLKRCQWDVPKPCESKGSGDSHGGQSVLKIDSNPHPCERDLAHGEENHE